MYSRSSSLAIFNNAGKGRKAEWQAERARAMHGVTRGLSYPAVRYETDRVFLRDASCTSRRALHRENDRAADSVESARTVIESQHRVAVDGESFFQITNVPQKLRAKSCLSAR
jgi:hypothetical protein